MEFKPFWNTGRIFYAFFRSRTSAMHSVAFAFCGNKGFVDLDPVVFEIYLLHIENLAYLLTHGFCICIFSFKPAEP